MGVGIRYIVCFKPDNEISYKHYYKLSQAIYLNTKVISQLQDLIFYCRKSQRAKEQLKT